ncbi:FkbM family methyltransferase [Francisella philomiragia]|uniref:FkbM family methyltransferase n=1 Tax=Francisella philomiragia TaxID=28110 RepID=UPI001906F8E3|nr:FkbM family methyltransferase [Francisella philomiragia]MBK2297092.1 FkbM family methyltransferase [Francisella philomiragia]MBK2341338.1 FkbM family methyltransferase [Francisella philomiragia]
MSNYDLITEVHRCVAEKMPDNPMLQGWSSFSQCDEDGIIEEILNRISPLTTLSKTCVEMCCGNGVENNTHLLLLSGYRGVWFDGSNENIDYIKSQLGLQDYGNDYLLLKRDFITLQNIVGLINDSINFLGTDNFDVFSLDIDGNDYYILSKIISLSSPKIIVCEYNAKFKPPLRVKQAYDSNHAWASDDYYSASLQTFVDLLSGRYTLICCNASGVNAFFVRNDLLDNFTIYPVDMLFQIPKYNLCGSYLSHPSSMKWLKAEFAKRYFIDTLPESYRLNVLQNIDCGLIDCIDTKYGKMFIDKTDNVISQSLAINGEFQESKISEVTEFLINNHKFAPSLFVDIGSNIGTHTIYAVKKAGYNNAISYEPEFKNFSLLLANIKLNSLNEKVSVYNYALSDCVNEEQLEMELSEYNYGDHRIKASNNTRVSFGEESSRQLLKINAINSYIALSPYKNSFSKTLVWIDTQGHEGNVFDGMQNIFLDGCEIPYIVCEFWPYGIERAQGKEAYISFLEKFEKIYDINYYPFRLVSIEELIVMYDQMLNETEKEYHPHTDLLLIF